MEINRVLDRLDKVRSTGFGKWIACCPAHDDKTPSLAISLNETRDKILLKCWAGCDVLAIVRAMQLSLRDLFAYSRPLCYLSPRLSPRHLFDALETELLILAQLAHKRAYGQEINSDDAERELIAWQRIDVARRTLP